MQNTEAHQTIASLKDKLYRVSIAGRRYYCLHHHFSHQCTFQGEFSATSCFIHSFHHSGSSYASDYPTRSLITVLAHTVIPQLPITYPSTLTSSTRTFSPTPKKPLLMNV
jgi:hypothetical protein